SQVDSASVGAVAEIRRALSIKRTIRRSNHGSDVAGATEQGLLQPRDGVVRLRLDGRATRALLTLSDGVEQTNRQAASEASANLGCAQDRRIRRTGFVAIDSRELWRPANAARVKEARA